MDRIIQVNGWSLKSLSKYKIYLHHQKITTTMYFSIIDVSLGGILISQLLFTPLKFKRDKVEEVYPYDSDYTDSLGSIF